MAGMQPHDVFRLTSAADPRVSPDGATVAYVVAWVDEESREPRSAIWAVPVDGSTEPRRLTFGPKRDATPRWSPDGRWLAFTSVRDGDVGNVPRGVVGGWAEAVDRDRRRLCPSLVVPEGKPHRRVLRTGFVR